MTVSLGSAFDRNVGRQCQQCQIEAVLALAFDRNVGRQCQCQTERQCRALARGLGWVCSRRRPHSTKPLRRPKTWPLETMARLLLPLLAACCVLSCSATATGEAAPSTAGGMDAADLAGLLRLRDAQPAEVRMSCAALAAWGTATAPCGWPGVTCSGADGGANRRVAVIDLRYCGLTVLPAEAMVWDELIVLEVRGNSITELPSTVNHLRSMQRIMIEMNQVASLPDQICECSKVRFSVAFRCFATVLRLIWA